MINFRLVFCYVTFVSFLCSIGCSAVTDTASSSTATVATSTPTSIPRSVVKQSGASYRFPPWNPSPEIDDNGFLRSRYERIPGEWEGLVKRLHLSKSAPAVIRQVPGDGNCLFHSISTAYIHAVNGTHIDFRSPDTMNWLYQHSSKLRQLAVDCLEERVGRSLLFLHGHEYLRANELVAAAASQYGITSKEYCQLMRKDSYWGGGPEIVALCNVLERPIHLYELDVKRKRHTLFGRPTRRVKANQGNEQQIIINSKDKQTSKEFTSTIITTSKKSDKEESTYFVLRRMACFGSPKFDTVPPLHILSADSRFPDIDPGEQLPSGNHFLAIFPQDVDSDLEKKKKKKRKRDLIRGGTNGYDSNNMDDDYEDEDDEDFDHEESRGWWNRLWNRLW